MCKWLDRRGCLLGDTLSNFDSAGLFLACCPADEVGFLACGGSGGGGGRLGGGPFGGGGRLGGWTIVRIVVVVDDDMDGDAAVLL